MAAAQHHDSFSHCNQSSHDCVLVLCATYTVFAPTRSVSVTAFSLSACSIRAESAAASSHPTSLLSTSQSSLSFASEARKETPQLFPIPQRCGTKQPPPYTVHPRCAVFRRQRRQRRRPKRVLRRAWRTKSSVNVAASGGSRGAVRGFNRRLCASRRSAVFTGRRS